MRILFETDAEGITYAISQDVEYEGYHYTELLWAEIDQIGPSAWRVRYETDFTNAKFFETLGGAKQSIILEHDKYKPMNNGIKTLIK